MDLVRQLERHLDRMNSAECCSCNVNKSQCFMIVEIGRKPGISVKELADILRIDKSGVSRFVEDLVQKGFVERKASVEDRRFVTLHLLQKGQERFEEIEHDMNCRFKEVLEQIQEDKQAQVIEALKIYSEACLTVEGKSND